MLNTLPQNWRERPIRLLLILAATAAAFWLSLAWTVASVFADRAPEVSLSWWSGNTEAMAEGATRELRKSDDDRARQRARRLAEAALGRDPLNVTALEALGALAAVQHDEARAGRIFKHAQTISRRGLPTQMWLIEERVRAGDIAGALVHYHRALSTRRSSYPVLLPILSQASAEPEVAKALAPVLAARPLWWKSAADAIVNESPRPGVAIPLVVPSLRLRPSDDYERGLLSRAMNRLVDAGEYAPAGRLYRLATRSGSVAPVRNGSFEQENVLPPFEWQISEDPSLTGIMEPIDNRDGRALRLVAGDARAGEAARQLVELQPGQHQLSAVFGGEEAVGVTLPSITLTCAGKAGRQVANLRPPSLRPGGITARTSFSIPTSGCKAQWLAVSIAAPVDGPERSIWVDDIAVR